jgi:hypothetical protein
MVPGKGWCQLLCLKEMKGSAGQLSGATKTVLAEASAEGLLSSGDWELGSFVDCQL